MTDDEGAGGSPSLSTDKPVEKKQSGVMLLFRSGSGGKLFTKTGTIQSGQEFRVSKKESKRYLKLPGVSAVVMVDNAGDPVESE